MLLLNASFLLSCYLYVSAEPPSLEDVKRLHTDMFNEYDKSILPLKTNDKPVTVQIKINVVTINNFDDISGEIGMTVSLFLSWYEERIQWEKGNYSNISSIIVPYENIWRPQIFLVNAADKIKEIGHEGIMVRVYSDGQAAWSPGQVLKSTCFVNVKYYPFDTQKCDLIFIGWSYFSSELQLEDKNGALNMSLYMENSQWEFLDSSLHPGFFEDRHLLHYKFQLKRRSRFFVLYLISPVIFLGILNQLVFAMPVSSGERTSVAITVFLAFAVYMGIINDNMPDSSAPMASIFYYLLFLLIHSSNTMLLTVISLRIHDKDGPVFKPIKILVKLLRFHYCSPEVWRKIYRSHLKNNVTDIIATGKSATKESYEDKKAKRDYTSNITWKVVGKTVDAYFFVCSMLLHLGVSCGFILSIYMNTFP